MVVASCLVGMPAAVARPEATAPTRTAAPASPITVTLLGVTPRLPDPTPSTDPIVFTAQITNTSSEPLTDATLHLERSNPIVRADVLQGAVGGKSLGDIWEPPVEQSDIVATLDPGQSVTRTLTTLPDPSGLCLCQTGVYAVDVVAVATSSSDGSQVRSTARTFIPSFQSKPAPVRVSWIWPLIDRPHRGVSPSVFTDDDLATSASTGGRLDRALKTIELLPDSVRVSLVVDPELIDALSVMAKGYTVRTSAGTTKGTGGPAAQAWLDRLKTIAPREDISLTGYADPDVDAVVNTGLSWSPSLDPQVAARVIKWLGQRSSTISWPVGETLTDRGLDSVVANGSSLVILKDSVLASGTGQVLAPNALAPLPSAGGNAHALVTDTGMEASVAKALSSAGAVNRNQQLTTLLAQLAVRAAGQPDESDYAVLVPPRAVDVQPTQAAAVINSSSQEAWAKSITPAQALATVEPVDHGSLKPSSVSAAAGARMRKVAAAIAAEDSFRDCLASDDAATLLAGYGPAIQRAQSSAWRADPVGGSAYVATITAGINGLRAGIRLVQPPNSQYTLASSDAPLYITVENALTRPVRIRIRVTPALGVQGFSATPRGAQTIPAARDGKPTRITIKVPAHVERTGRFRITVQLETPSGGALGRAVPLKVRSNAFGTLALWITGIAFAILVLAILIRLLRRVRARRRKRPVATIAPAT